MDFTKPQLAAIDPKNAGRDTCVVAGPGSGKTSVLVEFYRKLVIEADVDPRRILAITFTEKAARNMKERLAECFRGLPERRRQLEQANVSTIHGFCARLLRENAVLAGIDPEFGVLDARQATIMQRKAAADALDGMFAEQPEAMRRLIRGLASPDLAGEIPDIYDAMRCAGMTPEALRRFAPPRAPGLADLRSALGDLANEDATGWHPAQRDRLREILNAAMGITKLPDGPVTAGHFRAINAFPSSLAGLRQKTSIYNRLKTIKDELLPDICRTFLTEYYSRERGTLIAVIEHFDRLYCERKRRIDALDYSDLEFFSVRLLEESAALREGVRSDFQHVLMDELQDTNGQQAQLLRLVRGPGRFYAVGDINQSIYGFRHADPGVFRDYRGQVGNQGAHELMENWRSRADVLLAVEAIAGHAEGIEPRTLTAAKQFPQKLEPSVEVLAATADTQEEALDREARLIANRIQEMEGKLQLAKGPAGFGDIAVLVRNTDVLTAMTGAFEDAGIPYLLYQGKGFFETREVLDLTHLLLALANPRDEISLSAVLRSPFVGISDEALLRLTTQANLGSAIRRFDPATVPLGAEDCGKVLRFQEQLKRWRESCNQVGFDRALMRAMDETGYGPNPGSRDLANIEKFLSLAREASTRVTLAEFVEELERMRESDARDRDPSPEDAVNAVRIMTMHAAKGLEFPIVFLAALHKGVQQGVGPLAFSPRVGMGAKWVNPVTAEDKRDWFLKAIEDETKRRENEEGHRLLYVAMTRAEEHLVLSLSNTGKLKDWAAMVQAAVGEDLGVPHHKVKLVATADGETFPLRLLAVDRPPESAARDARDDLPDAIQMLTRPPVKDQHDFAASVTSITLYADCPRRYYLERYLGWRAHGPRHLRITEDNGGPKDDLDASELGQQVHALLAGEVVEAAQREALKLADVFRTSQLGRRAARASRVEREFDFLMAVDDVVLSGQIDLWFEEGDELVLVDYKTDEVDAVDAAARSEFYAPQLRLYAMALERLTGKAPDWAFVFFLRPGVAVPVDLERTLFNDPEELVRGFRRAQSSLAFPLNEGERCTRCPFFRGLCPAGASGMTDEIHPPSIDGEDLGGDEARLG